MFPTPSPSAQAAPLPPLPDMGGNKGASAAPPDQGSAFAALLSGIMPVKTSVEAINAACKKIVQSGAVPGSEQICAQIVALANQLVPMAAQQAMGGNQPVAPQGPPPPPGAEGQ